MMMVVLAVVLVVLVCVSVTYMSHRVVVEELLLELVVRGAIRHVHLGGDVMCGVVCKCVGSCVKWYRAVSCSAM